LPQDGEKAKNHKLLRIVIRQKRILKRERYPLRRSKYSNHIFNDHQHLMLLVLRQHFKKSYKEFCHIMEVCIELRDEIGLSKVPHWMIIPGITVLKYLSLSLALIEDRDHIVYEALGLEMEGIITRAANTISIWTSSVR